MTEKYELGGNTLAYKLNWNDLIIKYVERCGHYFALCHINRKYAAIYVSWVKNLHSILIPYLNDSYHVDMKSKLVDLEEKYVYKRKLKEWSKVYAPQYEIDKFFYMFQCLMTVIKKEGFLQVKSVNINMRDLGDIPKPRP